MGRKERLSVIINFEKRSVLITLGSFVLVINLSAVAAAIDAYAGPFTLEGQPTETATIPQGIATNTPDIGTDSIEAAMTPQGTAANAPDSATDSRETAMTPRTGIFAADFWDEVSVIYMITGDGIVIADLIMCGN